MELFHPAESRWWGVVGGLVRQLSTSRSHEDGVIRGQRFLMRPSLGSWIHAERMLGECPKLTRVGSHVLNSPGGSRVPLHLQWHSRTLPLDPRRTPQTPTNRRRGRQHAALASPGRQAGRGRLGEPPRKTVSVDHFVATSWRRRGTGSHASSVCWVPGWPDRGLVR